MNKLHLAFVIGSMRFGGAERAVLNLVNSLSKKGHKIDLIMISAKGEFISLVSKDVRNVDLNSSKSIYANKKFSKYLSENNPDIVVAFQNHVQLMVLISALFWKYKGKIVLNEQSTFSQNNNGFKGLLQKVLSGLIFSRADKIIAVSNGVMFDLIKNFPKLKDRMEVIYNPIEGWDVKIPMKSIPSHPFFGKDKKVIVAAGRLTKSKNFELLLQAFRIVNHSNDYYLLILGEGEERNNLLSLAKNIGIEQSVSFPGFVSDPLAYFSKADLFVLSSNYEGLPGVLIEALSCGCKIVSTDCNYGPAEILENGKYGKLVPVNNVQKLAESIKIALNENVDATILRNRAKDFSIETIAEQYLLCFEKLLFTSVR